MRHWALSAAIGAAILIFSSGAESAPQGAISGSFALDPQRSDDAFHAIESAIASLPNAKRPSARIKLRKSIAVDRIRISSAANRFSIKYDAHPPIIVSIGGEPVKYAVGPFSFDVSAKANGEAISLTFRGDDSERTTVYRSVGQELVEETVIISTLLPTPIRYKLVYNRAH